MSEKYQNLKVQLNEQYLHWLKLSLMGFRKKQDLEKQST